MDQEAASGKILVVDDEPRILWILEQSLKMQGYQVVTARDGVEALQKIQAEAPDLVLLDLMMPRMDGWTVLEQLRAQPDTMELPVIILSALDQDADLERGTALGCDIYIPKPWEPEVLISAVERMLEFSMEQKLWRDDPGGEEV